MRRGAAQQLSDSGLFFFESLKSFSVTASLVPSSRFLVAALLQSIDFGRARVVLELGTGTGVVTAEILRRMPRAAALYGIDVNPAFVSRVRRRIRDPRFVSILGRAENLSAIAAQHGIAHVDAIVSSLGLATMTPEQRAGIMGQVSRHLRKGGVLTQYQYLHARPVPPWLSALGLPGFAEDEFLRRYFAEVRAKKVVWNFPPATVYTCKAL